MHDDLRWRHFIPIELVFVEEHTSAGEALGRQQRPPQRWLRVHNEQDADGRLVAQVQQTHRLQHQVQERERLQRRAEKPGCKATGACT